MALSTTQNANNRSATTDVTLNADGTLTPGEAAQVITLEKDGDHYLFNVGAGYLYAASSSANYLRTETTADDNANLVNYDEEYTLKEGGKLCDIVPTLLEVMGMEQPAEMTGQSLLVKK